MISSAETRQLINSDSLPWKVLCCLTSEPLIGLDVDDWGGTLWSQGSRSRECWKKTSRYFFYLKKQTVFFSTKVELNNSDIWGGTNKQKVRWRMLTGDVFLSAIHCSIWGGGRVSPPAQLARSSPPVWAPRGRGTGTSAEYRRHNTIWENLNVRLDEPEWNVRSDTLTKLMSE